VEEAEAVGQQPPLVARGEAGELAALPEGVFAANVALALAACDLCGIPRDAAFSGILAEAAVIAPRATIAAVHGVQFVDGFAVNDVPSAADFLTSWRHRYPECNRLVIVFNSRADRPLRSRLFAPFLTELDGVDRIVLTGTHSPYMRHALRVAGYPPERIVLWNRAQAENAGAELAALNISDRHLVVGLGNIAGDGHRVAAALTGEVARAV